MEPLLLWGFGLLAAAVLLFVVELFLPSGGVLGFVAAVAAIAACVAFWRVDPWWGIGSSLLVLTSAPLAFNFAIKIMPHTPMGRALILGDEEDDTQKRAVDQQRESEAAKAIIGATGTAITPLRPIGLAEIEGQRIEVLAEGGPVDAGAKIRITGIVDNQVRVRPV
jgi:membrane-bound ClpP family serine protease